MLNLDGLEKPSKIAGFAMIEASKPGTRSPENRKRYGRPRFYSPVLLPVLLRFRIELRITCQSLLQPQPNLAIVENRTYLFKASHAQTVRFIDQNERSRIGNPCFLLDVFLCDFAVRRLEFRDRFPQPIVFVHHRCLMFLVPLANGFESFFLSNRSGRLAKSFSVSRARPISLLIDPGVLTTDGV